MKSTFAVAAFLLALMVGQNTLLACGDKFFLVGTGARFSRAYASLHPGSVLIYTGGTSAVSKGLRDVRLHKFIKNAGHTVVLVADRAELERALQSGSGDVVLAGLGQAVDLVPVAAAARSKPTILPIQGDGPDAGPAPQFSARLKSSDKVNRFLAGIEDVMEKRTNPKG